MFHQLMRLDITRKYDSNFAVKSQDKVFSMTLPEDYDPVLFRRFELDSWERSFSDYDKYFTSLTNQVVSCIGTELELVSKDHVVDLACGPGHCTQQLVVDYSVNAVGVDFSEAMISVAARRYPNISFYQSDIESMPFEDESFDAAIMNFGILHLSEPYKALAEAFRVLKPGKRIAFSVWSEPKDCKGFEIILRSIEEFHDSTADVPSGLPFFFFSKRRNSIEALEKVGFTECRTREVRLEWSLPDPEELFFAFLNGTARIGGLLRSQSDQAQKDIKRLVTEEAGAYFVNGIVKMPMSATIFSAVKTSAEQQH